MRFLLDTNAISEAIRPAPDPQVLARLADAEGGGLACAGACTAGVGRLRRPFADGQIAATAVTHGLLLVTRNVGDFEDFTDLGVETWWSGTG